jgi:hypothetical protein
VLRYLIALALCVGTVGPAAAEPPTTHEIIYNRPSGFWTSNRPAENGAYRYRLLAIGVVVAFATGLLMRRIIRKANADRDRRNRR